MVAAVEQSGQALHQLLHTLAAFCRKADDVLTVRQYAEVGVALVENADARRVLGSELADKLVDDARLLLPVGV